MITVPVDTPYGKKQISVYSCDILDFDGHIDILTTSAHRGSYEPVPNTMFEALARVGIWVKSLAAAPLIDLRSLCGVWMSGRTVGAQRSFGHIGCIEMGGAAWSEQSILTSIKAYFHMLDIAGAAGVPISTVAMPLLGGGRQHISSNLTLIPMIRECTEFLRRCQYTERILFIERSPESAMRMVRALESSYSVSRDAAMAPKACADSGKLTFISYSSPDRAVAESLCRKLEARGMPGWYAPRNIVSKDYATAIVEAIESASHFTVILSRHSFESEHVLNEIDLAFKELRRGIHIRPIRLDDAPMPPAFSYYLSRQHWMMADTPPLEEHLERFADSISENL